MTMYSVYKNKVVRLIVGFIAIITFAFVIIPIINHLELVEPIVTANKNNEINTSGLFYTEVEVSTESENYFNKN